MLGWDIPVAVMPMPTMGGTGPGNMISMTVLGNCEVLSTLCLIQAAAPGTPFIYAPVLGAMNPPSQGTVTIDDIDIYSLTTERQADFRHEYVGFVFQQLRCYPPLAFGGTKSIASANHPFNSR